MKPDGRSRGFIAMVGHLTYVNGLWLGAVPSPYGPIEIVLDGTPQAPDENMVAAIQTFMTHVGEIIERLRHRLPIAFLWKPVRLAVNNKNRVGVQFQHRILNRRKLLFVEDD
jgi:hypothetical protein